MNSNIISFSIPCYNSEKTIVSVIDEIKMMILDSKYDYEIVAAIDGSPDNVYDVLMDMAGKDKKIKVLNFSKNFGQASARMASLKYATGKYIVCLDDDGQCPMDRLWDLIKPLEEGKDVSIADYPHKKQSLFKNFGSRLNRLMARALLEVPKGFRMSNFFAMRQFVARRVTEYSNPYPYMTGLLAQTTQNFEWVKMEERERIEGSTGYTLKKLVSLWMNGFTSFSVKPLRISSFTGIVCATIGFVFGLVTIIRKLINVNIAAGYSSMIAIMLFIGGLVMVMLGMVGEYIGRIYISLNNSPQYVIKDVMNLDTSSDDGKREE